MIERNISQYDKITKDVISIGPSSEKIVLIVKHIIQLNKNSTHNTKIGHFYEYNTKVNYNSLNKIKNLTFTKTLDCLVLESRMNKNLNSEYNEYVKCRIYYKDFVDIMSSLNIVEKWFSTIKDLYTIDGNDRIIDLKSSYKDLIQISFFKGSNGRYLSFQPTILYDYTITYPSVEIKCDQGILCNISYDEFLTLKLCLEEYMKNFNLFSMIMLQSAYLHCIGSPNDDFTLKFDK